MEKLREEPQNPDRSPATVLFRKSVGGPFNLALKAVHYDSPRPWPELVSSYWDLVQENPGDG
jgi:hypothetical protein